MRTFLKSIYTLIFVGFGALLISSCVPVFSEMQSAKLVGKSNIELTPGFSSIVSSFKDEGDRETEHVQNHIGIQAGYGLSNGVDLRLRYGYIWVDDEGGVAHVVGVGPKISLLRNHIAFYIPVGFAFGGDIEDSGDTWQVHPTVLGTIPIASFVEVNPSLKYLIPFQEDSDNLLAVNMGFGLSGDFEKWVIRPEFGLLYNPGEEGHYQHFSIGVTFFPGRSK
jgi:hypothetical protein